VIARWAKGEELARCSGPPITSMSGKAAQTAARRHTRRVGGRGWVQAAIAKPTAACEIGVGTAFGD
jgi:hypothetical protein